MKKTICINPVDEIMTLRAEALFILNSFKMMGFVKRSAFVELVMDKTEFFNDYAMIKRLEVFWEARVQDEAINTELSIVLESLKAE